MGAGFLYKDTKITVKIRSFVCDAPARCSILYTKSHCAYFGCGRCEQEGDFKRNRMTFPESDATLRTDESFRTKRNKHYQHGTSCIEDLPIDIIEQFPLDYLHVVCLGVVKKCW